MAVPAAACITMCSTRSNSELARTYDRKITFLLEVYIYRISLQIEEGISTNLQASRSFRMNLNASDFSGKGVMLVILL